MSTTTFNRVTRILVAFRRRWYIAYNRAMFHLYGVKLGYHSEMFYKVYLRVGDGASITIGDNFLVSSGGNANPLSSNKNTSLAVEDHASIEIGNYCGMSGTTIWATSHIKIGNHVSIGANCSIIDGDMHSLNWEERMECDCNHAAPLSFNKQPIIIGNHVWVGANTIILKGVHIGDRTVIAAGSVVTRDIPADCVAGGNPCKVIKQYKQRIVK